MCYSRVISVFQRGPSITSGVCLFSSRPAGCSWGVGSVGCPCHAAHCCSLRSLGLSLGQGLASICVAGSASRAAQQRCSGESMSTDCPSTGAGTSVQAALSLAGRLVSTVLLLRGCSRWDLDAHGPFHAGVPAPPKGACNPEQRYGVDSLLVLSSGEIPSLFGQTSSFTAALPARGKGWLLGGRNGSPCLGLSGQDWAPRICALSSCSVHQNISR